MFEIIIKLRKVYKMLKITFLVQNTHLQNGNVPSFLSLFFFLTRVGMIQNQILFMD